MLHTVSSVKKWRSCRRLYRYHHVDLVVPVRSGKAREFGTGTHAGLEPYWHGAGLSSMLDNANAACVSEWWQTDDGQIERARMRAILAAYHRQWSETQRDWQTLDVEGQFEFGLVEGSSFGGKRDALARHVPTGKLYIVEHKTSSEDIGDVGCDYWQRLALDLQLTVYQEAVRAQLGEMPGLLYDVIRKPGGNPKLKEAIRRRKDESDEALEARKAAVRETLAEFEARLLADMLAESGQYLVRREVHRTSGQCTSQLDELRETVREIDAYRGNYPRNDDTCRSWFGSCAYLGVCAGVEQLDSERFVKLDASHPELSDDDPYSDCPL